MFLKGRAVPCLERGILPDPAAGGHCMPGDSQPGRFGTLALGYLYILRCVVYRERLYYPCL